MLIIILCHYISNNRLFDTKLNDKQSTLNLNVIDDKADKTQFIITNVSFRNLQGDTKDVHAMRLIYNTELLDSFTASNPQLTSHSELSKRVLKRVATYISTYFRVNFYQSTLIPAFICSTVSSSRSFTASFDLYVVILGESSTNESYFAYASPCLTESSTGRTVLGSFTLNYAYISLNPRREFSYFPVFLHEITHLLGFSSDEYSNYIDKQTGSVYTTNEKQINVTINSTIFSALAFPDLVSFAKSYYGCNDITGVPLENGGGSGSASSHWELLFLPNELMSPQVMNYMKITDFTLSLLRLTSWYDITDNAAQEFSFSKGIGCSALTVCPTQRGYCTEAQLGMNSCSYDYKSKSKCRSSTTFTPGCYLLIDSRSICEIDFDAEPLLRDSTETYGPNSRCIEWKSSSSSSNIPKCHKTNCVNGNTIEITVRSGDVYQCQQKDQLINVDSSNSIICPDPVDFCSKLSNKCTDDCYKNGNGICMKDNTCFCFYGKDSSTNTCNTDPAFMIVPKNTDLDDQIYPPGSSLDTAQSQLNNTNNKTSSEAYRYIIVYSLILIVFLSIV